MAQFRLRSGSRYRGGGKSGTEWSEMDLDDLANVWRSSPPGQFLPSFASRFQSTGDPGDAEVAGMTIPEHGHIRIPVQTAPMGGV